MRKNLNMRLPRMLMAGVGSAILLVIAAPLAAAPLPSTPAAAPPHLPSHSTAPPHLPIPSASPANRAAPQPHGSPQEIPFSALGSVSGIAMFGNTDGWAVSNRGIFTTVDGGSHWRSVLRGDANLTGFGAQTAFVNDKVAYVVLPIDSGHCHLFSTNDRGRAWRRTVINVSARSIIQMSFPNAGEGWAMAAPDGAAGPMQAVSVYHITNGGAHARLLISAALGGVSSHGLSQMWLKLGIYFHSSKAGWIPTNSWNNAIVLYQTTDGGSLWRSRDISTVPRPFAHRLAGYQYPGNPVFFSPSSGVLPVDFFGSGFCLYTTSDGGKHWTFTRPLLGKSAVFYDVVNSRQVFVWLGRTLYQSANLGHSWTVVTKALPPNIAQLDFATSRVGYAAGHALWRTANGGKSWVKMSAGQPS